MAKTPDIPPAWQEKIWSSLVGDPARQDIFTMKFEEPDTGEVYLILQTSSLKAKSPNLRPNVPTEEREKLDYILSLLEGKIKTETTIKADPPQLPCTGGTIKLLITLQQSLE